MAGVRNVGNIWHKIDKPVETPKQQNKTNKPEKSPTEKEKSDDQDTNLTELSIKTLADYINKSSGVVAKARLKDTTFKTNKTVTKRLKGLQMASKKLLKDNDHADTEEGSISEDTDDDADTSLTISKLREHLKPSMGAGAYVKDFIKSKNSRFQGKSKEQRQKMALGAYYGAKNEEVKSTKTEPKFYHIIHSKSGKVVGKATNLKRARNAMDKHDNNYGSYAHRVVPVYEESEDPAPTSAIPDYDNKKLVKTKALLKALANKTTDLIITLPNKDIIDCYWICDNVETALGYINKIHDLISFRDNELIINNLYSNIGET